MSRPKKKKNNMEELSQQVLEAVTDVYLNSAEDTADENGKMYLNVLADEFSMSRIKLRKLLITSGAYETSMSRQVNIYSVPESPLKRHRMSRDFQQHRSAIICLTKRPSTIWMDPHL